MAQSSTVNKIVYGFLIGIAIFFSFSALITDLQTNYPDVQFTSSSYAGLNTTITESFNELNNTGSDIYITLKDLKKGSGLNFFDIGSLFVDSIATALILVFKVIPNISIDLVDVILSIFGLSQNTWLSPLIFIGIIFALIFWLLRILTKGDV